RSRMEWWYIERSGRRETEGKRWNKNRREGSRKEKMKRKRN
ncbi:4145_t:CDS:1, partial [Dentiscutata heterogama]